jgi:magnesium chelatase subunit D
VSVPRPPTSPPAADETRKQIDEAARRTLSRDQLRSEHAAFAAVSPQVGVIDPAALDARLRRDPERAVALLADMAVATDPELRADARRLAAATTGPRRHPGPARHAATGRAARFVRR